MSQQAPAFPPEARLGMVVGLVEVVVTFGGKADIALISRELQTEVNQLLPPLEASEQLGLLKVEGGDASVTPLGQKLSRSMATGKKKLLREEVVKLEPFSTALRLSRERKDGFTADDLALELSKNEKLGVYAERTQELHELLVDWLLYTELLDYDGGQKRFRARYRKTQATN